jgi:putative flippase GtrA
LGKNVNINRESSRFLRFAIVGTIGAVVDFGVMNILRNIFLVPLVLAGTISFILAVINNFLLNRFWTFPDSRSKPFFRQFLEFSIVSIVGIIIRIPILKYLDPIITRLIFLIPQNKIHFSAETLSANITLAVAIVIVLFWNFFVNRYWTYNDVS